MVGALVTPSASLHTATEAATATAASAGAGGSGDRKPPPALDVLAQKRHCLLCDATFASWQAHCQLPSHVARTAICQAFVVPERSESIMQQLEKHIQLDFEAVDEVTYEKERRRRGRLGSTLVHLAEEGALYHSLPFLSSREDGGADAVQVSEEAFLNFALNGEGYARLEVLDRTARLMPRTGARELDGIVAFILSSRNLARLYDELDMAKVLAHSTNTPPPRAQDVRTDQGEAEEEDGKAVRLTRPEDKALVLLSCLGELAHLQRQDRSHSVADRAAADVLVRHVLATHAAENVLSELVHGVLQRVVTGGLPVWSRHQAEVRQRSTSTERAASASGASSAGPRSSSSKHASLSPTRITRQRGRGESSCEEDLSLRQDQLRAFLPLERIGTGSTAPGSKRERLVPAVGAAPAIGARQQQEQQLWRPMLRGLGMETAPSLTSAAAHPSATYAPVTPRLASRKPIG